MAKIMTFNYQRIKLNTTTKFSVLFFPALFVLLWSTGFIGAKYGLPYVEPFTFLFIRFGFATLLLCAIALVMASPWPNRQQQVFNISVSGLLLHGFYLGGIFTAISLGMSAGVAALIVGLQPICSCLFARYFLNESMSRYQWIGLCLGFCGVGFVVAEKILAINLGESSNLTAALLAVFVSLMGISYGVIFQKKYCTEMHPITGTALQYATTCIVMLILALSFETMQVQWTGEFIFALFWLVFVLSFGSIFILIYLIQNSSVSSVTSLFYMVPPVTAIEEYLIYHQQLSDAAIVGVLIVAVGVFITNKK